MKYFLVFLSLTQTQCAADALRRAGLSTSIVRPPLSLGRGSCSHALLVQQNQFREAQTVLGRMRLRPMVYQATSDGQFKEVRE